MTTPRLPIKKIKNFVKQKMPPKILGLIKKTSRSPNPDLIDVREVIRTTSIEELHQSADQYFLNLKNWDYHLAKPFSSVDEFPRTLIAYSHLIEGLNLSPGMKVIDFGAGSCWSTRILCQMGMQVSALDISPAALKLGKELFRRQPPFGDQPVPQFLPFNGHTIALPNSSVDRIICFDAFHHVPNPDQVIQEMGRVLKDGGIAGFSEPGPDHSKDPQSQYEMKNYKVVENDVLIEEIWASAQRAGFSDLKLEIFNPNPFHLSIDQFKEFVWHRSGSKKFVDETRSFISHRRLFFLYKGEPTLIDSSKSKGLLADLQLDLKNPVTSENRPFIVHGKIKNIGQSVWIASDEGRGSVQLGVHLFSSSGVCISLDYVHLPISEKRIHPGETVSVQIEVPAPTEKGQYTFEFDLVAEGVTWFGVMGSKTLSKGITVS